MGFWKNPIIEEPPRCLVCKVTVYDGSYVCSVTCNEIDAWREGLANPLMELEDTCYD